VRAAIIVALRGAWVFILSVAVLAFAVGMVVSVIVGLRSPRPPATTENKPVTCTSAAACDDYGERHSDYEREWPK
jgi:hypothetical protein